MVTVQERAGDREESLRRMLEGQQSGMWTALPGVVQSYNAGNQTVSVQPAIQSVITNPDGSTRNANMPLLNDVPVVFPGGGGATLTFPIKSGDECLVVFSSRSIDGWWQSGGVQPQAMPRMHSLSDGFALVGVRGRSRSLGGASTTETTLRSDDGANSVRINPTSNQITVQSAMGVDVQATSAVNITAPAIGLSGAISTLGHGGGAGVVNMTGTINITGTVNITGELVLNGINMSTHRHPGIQRGGAHTDPPTN